MWWPVNSNNDILLTFSFIRLGEHGGDTTPGSCTDGNYYVFFLSGFKKQFLFLKLMHMKERRQDQNLADIKVRKKCWPATFFYKQCTLEKQ